MRLERLFPADAPADEYRATVAAIWSISIDAADRLHPPGLAGPLLRVLGMLDPNGIPADLLTTDAITGLLNTCMPVPADGAVGGAVTGRDCQDAARNLARLSLLTWAPPGPGGSGGFARIRVHALVQRAATEHLSPDQIAPLVTAAADALVQAWPEIEHDPQLGQALRANTTALTARHPNALWDLEGHPVLWRAGTSLGETGLVAAATDYWTHLTAAATDHLGPDHPHTLTTRHNLARWRGEPPPASPRWRGEAGDPAGAAAAFEQLLTDYLRVLGPDHPHTLTTRHNLAYWRERAGDS